MFIRFVYFSIKVVILNTMLICIVTAANYTQREYKCTWTYSADAHPEARDRDNFPIERNPSHVNSYHTFADCKRICDSRSDCIGINFNQAAKDCYPGNCVWRYGTREDDYAACWPILTKYYAIATNQNSSACQQMVNDLNAIGGSGEKCEICFVRSDICAVDSECGGGLVCNQETRTCGQPAPQPECNSHNDCQGTTPLCNGLKCVACTDSSISNGDQECSNKGNGMICVRQGPTLGACEQPPQQPECSSHSECQGTTPLCNGMKCVACTDSSISNGNQECSNKTSGYVCLTSGSSQGACGECSTNNDCKIDATTSKVCDTTTNTCVRCKDSDANRQCGTGYVCDPNR